MAAATCLFVPNGLIGLIPIPLSSRMEAPISSTRNALTRRASAVPEAHSMPAYTSSVFSR